MAKQIDNLAGRRFGALTVGDSFERRKASNGTKIYWSCACDCGQSKQVRSDHLTLGKVVSCGCMKPELCADANIGHGAASRRKTTRTYNTWQEMRRRCYDANHKSFPDYGGRGITVCDRWGSFDSFLSDMGERPEDCTIERLDVNGIYSPDNCVWATYKEQGMNRRNTFRLFVDGKRVSRDEFLALSGITRTRFESEIAGIARCADYHFATVQSE